jgi:hypothetical protein
MFLAYIGHFLSVLDAQGRVFRGKTRGLRVGVRTGTGTGKAQRTRGLPVPITSGGMLGCKNGQKVVREWHGEPHEAHRGGHEHRGEFV